MSGRGLMAGAGPWLMLAGSAALTASLFLAPAKKDAESGGQPVVKVSRVQIETAMQAALMDNPSLGKDKDALLEKTREGVIAQSLFVAEAFSQGLAETDYIVRNRLVELQAMSLYERADAMVTPSAAASYFSENRGRYRSLPRRRYRHLFVPVTNLVSEDEARKRLEDIFADPAAREEPRWVSEDDLRKVYGKTLAETVFKMPVGEWSDAIRSPLGWHYLEVVEQDPARRLELDEVKTRVTEDLRREMRIRLYEQELERLRAKYRVEEAD